MKSNKAIVKHKEQSLVKIEESAMSVEALIQQVTFIQHIMEKVMKKDEHYGIIPGTDKPTLLKPGAEKLCLTFRLDPDYEIIREVREKDFIAYTVKCTLRHISTGRSVASGIGSCNSREVKYRYRYENTGQEVPKAYWDNRDAALLGGSGFRPRKHEGRWYIFEQKENTNPWDLDNTLIKMGCKRALVAATLNATAASDIFTQDLEDLSDSHPNQPEKTAGNASSIPDTAGERHQRNNQIQAKMNEYSELVRKLQSLGITPSSKITSIVNEAIKMGEDWDAKITFLKQEIAKYEGNHND